MCEPADPGDSARYFAWTRLRPCNEIGKLGDAERGIDHDEHRILACETDRAEVSRQVNRHISRCPWQRHEGRQDRHVKRVSIGWSIGCDARSDAAGRTRMIDRKDLLAPHLAKPIGNHPQDSIWRAARSRVRDNRDRPGRIVLGVRLTASWHRTSRNDGENNDAYDGVT